MKEAFSGWHTERKDPDGRFFWHRLICSCCLICFLTVLILLVSQPSWKFDFSMEDKNKWFCPEDSYLPPLILGWPRSWWKWPGSFGEKCWSSVPCKIQPNPFLRNRKGASVFVGHVIWARNDAWWRFRISFKTGFGMLDGACCITAGCRVSPTGLLPCLLSWGIPANLGSANCFCQPISNLAYVQSQFLDTMMEPGTSAAFHICKAPSEIMRN